MNRLLNIGFTHVGNWYLSDNGIRCSLLAHQNTNNVLYAFVSDGSVKYIGKTTKRLTQRMYGYQNPNVSQRTNFRVNGQIAQTLNIEGVMDIFVLPDQGLLNFGGFRINLAAGLEDTLIHEIMPDWNVAGRNVLTPDEESEEMELPPTTDFDIFMTPVLTTMEITLGDTYYNQGFFNVSREYESYFGPHGSAIDIQLGHNGEQTIRGIINRTANANGTPRIMGYVDLRNWIRANFEPGQIMQVSVISPQSIKVFRF